MILGLKVHKVDIKIKYPTQKVLSSENYVIFYVKYNWCNLEDGVSSKNRLSFNKCSKIYKIEKVCCNTFIFLNFDQEKYFMQTKCIRGMCTCKTNKVVLNFVEWCTCKQTWTCWSVCEDVILFSRCEVVKLEFYV